MAHERSGKEENLLTWMFRKRRECKKSLSDFCIFLQTVTMKGKGRPEEQWGTGVTSSSEQGFSTSLTRPALQMAELLRFSSTRSRPSHLSMTFKSRVLDPVRHGPHPWILKTLKLPSSFLGMGITRTKYGMGEKHDLALESLPLSSPPYHWPAVWRRVCRLNSLSLGVLVH